MQILFKHLSPMNIPTLPLNFLLDPASVQEKHSRPTRAGSGLYEDLPVLTLPVSSFSSSMIVCVCVWVVGGWLKGKWQRLGHEQGSVSRLAFSFAKLLQFSIKAIHTCMWWWICLYPPCIFVRVLPVRVFPIFHIKWKIFFMWPLLVFPPMRNGFFTRTPSKKAAHYSAISANVFTSNSISGRHVCTLVTSKLCTHFPQIAWHFHLLAGKLFAFEKP